VSLGVGRYRVDGQRTKREKEGEFTFQTIPNPRGHELLMTLTTLRSGKTIDNKVGTDETISASPGKFGSEEPKADNIVSWGWVITG
jgi:hypothetical protein